VKLVRDRLEADRRDGSGGLKRPVTSRTLRQLPRL
jgi:hypothetical protein